MLTLTRKVGQKVLIGNEIEILVREVRGRQVRISIVAPPGLPIMRDELFQMIADQNAVAAHTPTLEALDVLSTRVGKVGVAKTGARRVVGSHP